EDAGGSGLCHRDGNFLRLSLGQHFRREQFPIAAFLDARADRSDFAALLDDERRSALWARLGNWHVRRRKIRFRIARAAVENARATTATFAGATAANELSCTALRAFDAHGDGARVLALRISGATDEFSEAAVFFHQAISAQRALFIERLIGLVRN